MTKLCKCNLLDTTENDRLCVKEFRLYLIGLSLGYYNKIQCYKRTIAAISHVPEDQWLWWSDLHCSLGGLCWSHLS